MRRVPILLAVLVIVVAAAGCIGGGTQKSTTSGTVSTTGMTSYSTTSFSTSSVSPTTSTVTTTSVTSQPATSVPTSSTSLTTSTAYTNEYPAGLIGWPLTIQMEMTKKTVISGVSQYAITTRSIVMAASTWRKAYATAYALGPLPTSVTSFQKMNDGCGPQTLTRVVYGNKFVFPPDVKMGGETAVQPLTLTITSYTANDGTYTYFVTWDGWAGTVLVHR